MFDRKSVALLIAAILGLFEVSSALVTAGKGSELGPARFEGTDSIGDTLGWFDAPGSWPSGLAWDGTHFWLNDNDSDSLYRLSASGTVEAVFPLPESATSPAGMTWIGENLWFVDENTARLFELDTATGVPKKVFPLPDTTRDPATWGLAWDGEHLWHSRYAFGEIYELDTVSGAVISMFAAPEPFTLGIQYDGQYLWAIGINTSTAYVISLPSGTVIRSYSWKVPNPLGLTLANGYMWCVSLRPRKRVYKVDVGMGGLTELPGGGPLRRLARAVPNPFRVWTRISAGRGCPAIVGVRIFDIQGRPVRYLSASGGAVTWDGTSRAGSRATAGAYVIQVRFADGSTEQQSVRLSR